jgi:hypothetical protein
MKPVLESQTLSVDTTVLSCGVNAYAERWVRSVKQECLSKLILHESRVPRHHATLLTCLLLQECSLPKFRECLLQLPLSIHHDRAVPGHRFLERLS